MTLIEIDMHLTTCNSAVLMNCCLVRVFNHSWMFAMSKVKNCRSHGLFLLFCSSEADREKGGVEETPTKKRKKPSNNKHDSPRSKKRKR